MKIEPMYTEVDLRKLTRPQFHQKWFNEALTDRQMAKLYNTTVAVVRERRKELKLNWISAAVAFITGGNIYADDRDAEKRADKLTKQYNKKLEKEKKLRGKTK